MLFSVDCEVVAQKLLIVQNFFGWRDRLSFLQIHPGYPGGGGTAKGWAGGGGKGVGFGVEKQKIKIGGERPPPPPKARTEGGNNLMHSIRSLNARVWFGLFVNFLKEV